MPDWPIHKSSSQPHSGLTVTKCYEGPDAFASVGGHLIRCFDLKCLGCGTEWIRVTPVAAKPTIFCDECAALQSACDLLAQETLTKWSKEGRRMHFAHTNGNTGIFAFRDLLFDHVRGARELSRWDLKRLPKVGFVVPAFGSRSVAQK